MHKVYRMYCGIDVSKNKSNVCLLDEARNVVSEFEIEHNKEGLEELEKHLTKDTLIGMEVTGNYSKALYKQLSAKHKVSYLDSLHLNNFAKFSSPSIKNDKVDARLIATFLSMGFKQVQPVKMNELKDLCKLYNKTVKQLTKYKCMVKDQLNIIFPELEKHVGTKSNKGITNLLLKYPTPRLIASASIDEIHKTMNENLKKKGKIPIEKAQKIRELAQNSIGDLDYPTKSFEYTIKIMKFYQEQIKEIATSIESELMKSPYCNLINEFGYNKTSLAAIVSEVEDIRRFRNHKKFVSYCGLGVSQKQSGSSVRKKGTITKMGNCNLRAIFYMLVMVHLRRKTQFADFYFHLRERGKHPKACMTATARKLAVKAYYDLTRCHES